MLGFFTRNLIIPVLSLPPDTFGMDEDIFEVGMKRFLHLCPIVITNRTLLKIISSNYACVFNRTLIKNSPLWVMSSVKKNN